LSGRLRLLVGIVVGLGILSAVELTLFLTLGPLRALFVQIAGLGLLAAAGTVASRNLVHAALFLVAFFFLVACLFVLLEAEFMAAMQVLVYIGAVAILMMFGIMLTRNIQGDETTTGHWIRRLPPAVVSLALLGLLIYGINDEKGHQGDRMTPTRPAWGRTVGRPSLDPASPRGAAVEDMAKSLGVEMMTRWVVPFEVAGLLLTAALVGAIALAMSDKADDTPRRGALATLRPVSAGPGDLGNGDLPHVPLQTTATATASEPR
jgi:NADH-quinone oxidoreductase subunit J